LVQKQIKSIKIRQPHNKFEEIKNLYLVGGGTHHGSGGPTIYQSAMILESFIKPENEFNKIK
jgi:phytoene desaturase